MTTQRAAEIRRQLVKIDELIEVEEMVFNAWTLASGRRDQATRIATLRRVRDTLLSEARAISSPT